MGKKTSPSQEAFAIQAKKELKPQVEAGSHGAAKRLQNKHRDEEAQSAQTSRGYNSLGRCELMAGPWEPRLGGDLPVLTARDAARTEHGRARWLG